MDDIETCITQLRNGLSCIMMCSVLVDHMEDLDDNDEWQWRQYDIKDDLRNALLEARSALKHLEEFNGA